MCDPQNPSHCLQLFDKLSEYIDGEMEETERRELEAHLAHCAACFGCLQSIQRTIALCKQAGPQAVPPVFSTKLQTMIQHIRNAP